MRTEMEIVLTSEKAKLIEIIHRLIRSGGQINPKDHVFLEAQNRSLRDERKPPCNDSAGNALLA